MNVDQLTVAAPVTLTLRFCSTCGRDDRDEYLPDRHSRQWFLVPEADTCPGEIRGLTYVLWPGHPRESIEFDPDADTADTAFGI